MSAKFVIVTGGSRGLGYATIIELLAAGYRIATCSRGPTPLIQDLIKQQPDHLFWSAAEIGKEEQEQAFFKTATDWGGEDNFWALINNAGVAEEGILATFPNVDIRRIINVNLMGSLRMARLALRVLLRGSKGGRVVNISSILGLRGYTGLAPYSASKSGLDGMTRALAREVGRRNITVNSVNPGYMETEISATLSQRQKQQIINRTPMKRLAHLRDVTPLIRFILSDEARFITGQSIVVDGGITC